MYALAAAYDVKPIETKYRKFVVADFPAFLKDEDWFTTIAERRPFKLFNLVFDGVSKLEDKHKQQLEQAKTAERTKLLYEDNKKVEKLLRECRSVRIWIESC